MASRIDYAAIWESAKDNWKLILTIVGLIVLLFVVLFAFKACPNWNDRREVEGLKENVNAEQRNANTVIGNIANLKIQEVLKANEVERLEQELKKAQNELDQARNATDGAIENVSRAENANFTNSSLSEAEKARCRAFPDAPGCG